MVRQTLGGRCVFLSPAFVMATYVLSVPGLGGRGGGRSLYVASDPVVAPFDDPFTEPLGDLSSFFFIILERVMCIMYYVVIQFFFFIFG